MSTVMLMSVIITSFTTCIHYICMSHAYTQNYSRAHSICSKSCHHPLNSIYMNVYNKMYTNILMSPFKFYSRSKIISLPVWRIISLISHNRNNCQTGYCYILPSVLWRCWLGGRKGIRPVKKWVMGCWRGCLGWGADLHIAQQMPLPLTISCSTKSRLVLTFLVLPFWYLLTQVVPDKFQKSRKTVVCVCMCVTAI